ncbi:hypothetical protein HH214_01555 [Mucilaginibacter robiniae]|uniref:Uncharacterized protein n=1 Tax=Mucilaginibacter robiniae TaxID=2728022 RepID=A0A7L5DX26_9SPHI|nr:hypothetical protein [Mucilaginibacter robiniae]QJD94647.1 hypothetical protein HH214_01555 [Mucilaginibacter robiniae]
MNLFPNLITYKDLLAKLEHDTQRFVNDYNTYGLLDWFLTANALPEWISGSDLASEQLKQIARDKILIMKGLNGHKIDDSKLETDIDEQLRLIRLVCNQAKHSKPKKDIPVIKMANQYFPYTFPMRFGGTITIGEKEFDAAAIIISVKDFWVNIIKNND